MPKNFIVTISLVLISLIVSFIFLSNDSKEFERDIRAQHLKAGDFELLHNESVFKLSDLQGSPLVLYFGYTFCPDVCPVGLSRIREALLLREESLKDVPVAFVTVDPERDSAERLQEYVTFFHPNVIGLRGSVEQIKQVSAAYGTFFRSNKQEGDSSNEYVVDHSAYFYLINGEGTLMRVLDHDASAEEISELLHKLL